MTLKSLEMKLRTLLVAGFGFGYRPCKVAAADQDNT